MTDFFNSKVEGSVVRDVRMSSPKKVKATVDPLKGHTWSVHSKSRGKEIKLIFESGMEKRELLIHFFKGGVWEWYPSVEATQENPDYERDHRFSLVLDDGSVISHQDQFHQSYWKWSDKWGLYKSPDIVLENNAYRKHMYDHRYNSHFQRPIYQVMLHPWFFNGLNNFSRCEILSRTRFSPFTPVSEIFASEILREDLFETTKEVLEDIYRMGGTQLGLWKNPFGKDPSEFKKWIQVYQEKNSLRFFENRKVFYFHKRWKSEYRLFQMNQPETLDDGTAGQA
jgi:formamidopyrimidine-DNA glycosylase